MQGFFNDLVFAKQSAVHIIQNSIPHRHLFEQQGQAVEREVDSTIRDLGFAPHRFESRLKPLVRICLLLDQFLTTCVSIAVSRAGKVEGNKMRDVLNQITPESLVMVALLADAVTEGLQFLRRVDKEATHAETLFADVREYRLRLITLFGDHGCAYDAQRSVGTFVHVVRGALQRERALVFPGALGGAHVIGGQDLSAEVLQRCAGRMRDWVCMCLAALETEFPEWEIAQAFRVFDVSPKACLSAAMVAESIGRLAKKFAIDPTALKAQLEAVLPLARRRYHALGTSKAAMVAAIEDFAERVRVADCMLRALKDLRRVVCVWLTATFSTTGVEHMFVGAANVLRKRRGPLERARRHDELTVLRYAQVHGWQPLLNAWPDSGGSLHAPQGGGMAPPPAGKAGGRESMSWGRAAQNVWRRCYPRSRLRLMVRRDAGGRRAKRRVARTEAGFLQARRMAVDGKVGVGAVAGGAAPPPPEVSSLTPSSASAQKEVLLQKARRVRKICEEVGQSSFPANDDVALDEARRAVRLASGRLARGLDSAQAKKGAMVPLRKIIERLRVHASAAAPAQTSGNAGRRHGPASSAPRPDIPIVPLTIGHLPKVAVRACTKVARRVFVHPGISMGHGEMQELRRKDLVVSTAALDSDIFLVERLSGVDHDVLLSVFLVGGKLVTRNFLNRQARPATLQFVPAPFVRRLWLTFSAQLREARPRQVKMVEVAARRPGSAWTVVSESDWAQWHRSPKRNQCFAVYTSAEIRSMTPAHHGAIAWSLVYVCGSSIAMAKAMAMPW